MEETNLYKIIRHYSDRRPKRIIKKDLTLEQAIEHCEDPSTRKEGDWFDGWTKQQ